MQYAINEKEDTIKTLLALSSIFLFNEISLLESKIKSIQRMKSKD